MRDNNENKVRRGEPLRIPAETWNGVVDATKDYKRHKFDTSSPVNDGQITDLIKANSTVYIKNATAYDFDFSFGIARISGTIADVSADLHAANRRTAFYGYAPQYATDAIAILQQPCETEEIAKAVISGVTVCRVKITNAAHQWANPTPGETGWLTSATSGQARILAYETSEQPYFAANGIYDATVNLIGDICCEVNKSGSGVSGSTNPSSGYVSSGSTIPSGSSGSGGVSGVDIEVVTNVCPIFESGFEPRKMIGMKVEYTTIKVLGIGTKRCATAIEGACCPTSGSSGSSGSTGSSGSSGSRGSSGGSGGSSGGSVGSGSCSFPHDGVTGPNTRTVTIHAVGCPALDGILKVATWTGSHWVWSGSHIPGITDLTSLILETNGIVQIAGVCDDGFPFGADFTCSGGIISGTFDASCCSGATLAFTVS